MGNIPLLNVVKAGIAEIITNVEVEIGGVRYNIFKPFQRWPIMKMQEILLQSIGKGINGTARVLGNGISEILRPAWRYMGMIRGNS